MQLYLSIIFLLFFFITACSPKAIHYNYQLTSIRRNYSQHLNQQGWKETNNSDESTLVYYNDNYKSYVSVYIEQFVQNKDNIDWQGLTAPVLKQLSKASKLKITILTTQWETINKNQLLKIDAKGKRTHSPDFRIRIYWLVQDNILYKFICLGPEHYWPKVLFDFVGLIDYFTMSK